MKSIKGVTDDSRKVKKGFVFVAIKGEHFDGNDYISEAIDNGAAEIVSEKKMPINWDSKVNYRKVANARRELSLLACEFYANPSKKMTVIGVTGSDGKTTTSHMIYEVLKKAGKPVGLISTISAKIKNREVDTGFHVTNPEPLELQKLLSQMVKSGLDYVVLEVTSHGIDQERIAGINFDLAVLTNITHEHLDYHKTFSKYRDTKLRLFLDAKTSVLNKDDKNYDYLSGKIKNKKISYSLNQDADFTPSTLELDKLMGLSLPEVGSYNIQNALAAAATASVLGVSLKITQDALAKMQLPKGRLQRIKNTKGVNLYVDFAHTPNALQQVLGLLKEQTEGKLIVVFGCAGERDKQKRSMMARIATDISDFSVFTAEDPRSEKIEDILAQMELGVKNKKAARFKIAERGEAISFAVNELSKAGDTLVITGKAHEKSMAYNGIEYPWSDFEAVDMALKGKTLKIKR